MNVSKTLRFLTARIEEAEKRLEYTPEKNKHIVQALIDQLILDRTKIILTH